ncbi:hypothetical protein Ndes2526B_g01172 [Nannochloris sp. 'desiccata']
MSYIKQPNTANNIFKSFYLNLPTRRTVPLASNNGNSPPKPPPPPPPAPRRALGVDYGRKFIGLAVSTLGLAPRPLMNMRGGGLEKLMELAHGIVDAAVAESCDAIVIGLPVTSQGSIRRRQTDSQQGRRCRNFADAVAALTVGKDLYVYLIDERGTTVEAEALIGYLGGGRNDKKQKKDSVAAALILSAFFNEPRQAVRVRPPGMGRAQKAPPGRKGNSTNSSSLLQKGSLDENNIAPGEKKGISTTAVTIDGGA